MGLDASTLMDAAADQSVPTDDALAEIADLVAYQIEVEDQLEAHERKLRELKATLEDVRTRRLPLALQQMNLTDLRTKDGFRVLVKDITRASIPKARKDEALQWLNEEGHGDLIKHVVSASFGKGEDNSAREAVEYLESVGRQPKDERSVHPSTLSAFVREQIEAGVDVPHELFGVYVGQVAKIER